MRILIGLVLAAAAALAAYTFATTGELRLLPRRAGAEERALASLETRFERARRQVTDAGRAAGLAGVDTTAEVEAARRRVEEVREELERLTARLGAQTRQRATKTRARLDARAKRLRRAVDAFMDELR